MGLLEWMEGTFIADTVRTIGWVYPALESAHYIGIASLVGGIMLIDMRLLGVAPRLPIATMITLLPWVWAGFFINLFSGGIIFIYGATAFGPSGAFQLKMLLMVLAGVNALLFDVAARRGSNSWVITGEVPTYVKGIATLSFVLWIGVVTTGRWMAYV
jgi:hypothetical protein